MTYGVLASRMVEQYDEPIEPQTDSDKVLRKYL